MSDPVAIAQAQLAAAQAALTAANVAATAPIATVAAVAATPAIKPGWQTSEFWLSVLPVLLGLAASSGAFPAGGMAGQIIGGAMALLAGLGYTASRTSIKINAA